MNYLKYCVDLMNQVSLKFIKKHVSRSIYGHQVISIHLRSPNSFMQRNIDCCLSTNNLYTKSHSSLSYRHLILRSSFALKISPPRKRTNEKKSHGDKSRENLRVVDFSDRSILNPPSPFVTPMHTRTHVPIKSSLGVDPISSASDNIQRTDEPILPNFPLPPPPLPVLLREGTNLSFSRDSRTHMYTRTKPWTEAPIIHAEESETRTRARARSLARVAGVVALFFPPLRVRHFEECAHSLPVAAHLAGEKDALPRRTLITVVHFLRSRHRASDYVRVRSPGPASSSSLVQFLSMRRFTDTCHHET